MPKLMSFLCAMLLVCVPCLAVETNLLENAAFADQGADGAPAMWRGSGDAVVVISAELPGGQASAVVITVGKVANGLGEFGQRVAVKPGWIYRVAAQLKSDLPRDGLLQVKLYSGKREIKRFDVGSRSGAEWTAVQSEFVTPPDVDAVEILCRYERGDKSLGKTVQFAGLSLVPVAEKVYVAPRPTVVTAVATFESIGISVAYEGDASPGAVGTLHYRIKGQDAWRRGLDLVHRPSEGLFRGSILNLSADTEYEIECELSDSAFPDVKPIRSAAAQVRTWPQEVPIARTIRLPAGTSKEPLVITEKGTEAGWILVTSAGTGDSTVDAGIAVASAVVIKDSAYVIFENVIVRGGATRGIEVIDSHHVRVRRCDVAGWGNPGTRSPEVQDGRYVDAEGKTLDWQAGVHVGNGTAQVVVEGNFIHGPRGTSNSWAHGHPAGVQGVILAMTDGNNVVRNNEIIGSEQHWWNDGIESLFNERVQGGPYRDTDISGNVITFANDDGAELDGGQINVRFFNNWVQWAFCGVSCAPNMAGPSYVYRNLFVLTGEQRGMTNFGFKMGGDRFPDAGRAFLLHNTMISNNLGLSTGHMGEGATPITARNNAYLAGEIYLRGRIAGNYDLDYDLIQPGVVSPADAGQQRNAIVGVPTFANAAAGDYRPASGSKGIDEALSLPNVNDGFGGTGPDVGAFEQGASPALFPRRSNEMSALPLMSHLHGTAGGNASAAASIELIVPSDSGARWTAHSNADWLRCEPANGATGEGPRAVMLSADVSKLDAREYRGAVTFRTDMGHCRTVLVALQVRHAQPFAVTLEAEAGTLGTGFTKVADDVASGGAYLKSPDQRTEAAGTSLAFDVPVDGVYYVHGLIRVPGPVSNTHDSLFVAMDDGPRQPWHLQHLGKPDFHWMPVTDLKSEARTVAFQLAKGRHTLHVHPRETLTGVDALRVSNEPFMTEVVR